jgi:hypothetical protein
VIVQLGTCELCGSKGVVRHSGRRWACILCWPKCDSPANAEKSDQCEDSRRDA